MPAPGFGFRSSRDLLGGHERRLGHLETDNSNARAWAPSLTSNGSLPSSTGAALGTYVRTANWVSARFQIKLAAFSAGSGLYAIVMPWAPRILVSGMSQMVGNWGATHSAANYAGSLLTVQNDPNNIFTTLWLMDSGGGLTVGPTVPWTWASGDSISGVFSMEVAPGY